MDESSTSIDRSDGQQRLRPGHDDQASFTDDYAAAPPGLKEMFINSTDTLRHRELDQTIPETWNDRPPLFDVPSSSSSSKNGPLLSRPFLWRRFSPQQGDNNNRLAEQEGPNLLKGVSMIIEIENDVVVGVG